jgi:hypothetical protein
VSEKRKDPIEAEYIFGITEFGQTPESRQRYRLTEAEERFLATRERILARRNPELLMREKIELKQMTDEEIDAYLTSG